MLKKLLIVALILTTWLAWVSKVSAIDETDPCYPNDDLPNHGCDNPDKDGKKLFCKPKFTARDEGTCQVFPIPDGEPCIPNDRVHRCVRTGPNGEPLYCKPLSSDPTYGRCELDERDQVQRVFGEIEPPAPLAGFLAKNPTGAGAISQFLSNFVSLLFTIAMIALIFMILWAAFDWLTSGGDKEKLAAAQRRLLHAFIGILLFAVAFAIIRVLGIFTGFSFFKEEIRVLQWTALGNVGRVICPDGKTYDFSNKGPFTKDPKEACKNHGT